MTPTVEEQFTNLKRICVRGRSLFLQKEDSEGVDMFEHIETEIERLRVQLLKEEAHDRTRSR